MAINNYIKSKPVYKDIRCECGSHFSPKSSKHKFCTPKCRFISLTKNFLFDDDLCCEWEKGFFKSGYGQFALTPNKPEYAHRMSYRVFVGEIPDGMFICHKCDNRKCINPKHLFIGTPKANIHDMISKGRQQDYSNALSGEKHPHYGKKYIGKNLHLLAQADAIK